MADSSGEGWLARMVESAPFRGVVTIVVLVNAVVLGVLTNRALDAEAVRVLVMVDAGCVAFFIFELALKLLALRGRFFVSAWNVFDLVVVGLSLVPAAGPLQILRTFRVMRMLRIVSVVAPLRRVVEALFRAVPGITAILGVLTVFFYVGGVLATSLFGAQHETYFGSLGASVVSLFQLMLFDGWAEMIRAVEPTHPGATVFFIVFTVLTGFAVLNLFIAVMVDALREEHDRLAGSDLSALEQGQEKARAELDEVEGALGRLEAKIDRLAAMVEARGPRKDERA